MRPIAVVVVTWRSAHDIRDCLRSVLAERGPEDVIVVVDNDSPDDTVEVAGSVEGPIAIRRMERNLGFGAACNVGAAAAPGRDVLLLNPDSRLREGAIAALRAALAADATRGVVGPRIDRPDGSPEPGCRRSFPDLRVAFQRLARLDRLDPRRFGQYNRLGDDPSLAGVIDAGSGAALLVRREAWDAVGGFDERFFMYGEDLDLCYRIRQAGWITWYEPAAMVVHQRGASSAQAPLRTLYEFHRAMWLFFRKHHSRGAGLLVAPAVAVGIWGRFTALLVTRMLRRAHRRAP